MATVVVPDLHCFSCGCCDSDRHQTLSIPAARSSSCCRLVNQTSKHCLLPPVSRHSEPTRKQLPSSCQRTVKKRQPVAVEHTDVIVVGNGPSGICLSYVLSGHWPYYTGVDHSNELLTLRLKNEGTDKSLLQQDLPYLCDGLEGRSSNPVALLVDALSNPDADFGADLPSLLRWDFHSERAIPHVVLGQYDEGGIWQTIEDDIQTLSLGDWMQLPDMPFREWRDEFYSNKANVHKSKPELRSNRASAYEVRNYYNQFVESKGLRQYFRNRSVVTSIERVCECPTKADCESGEEEPNVSSYCPLIWEVRGHREVYDSFTGRSTTEEFCYRAPSVVLANGAFDVPNALRLPGEHQPYVLHSLTELDSVIHHGKVSKNGDPVVIIGSGLSAADAVLRTRAAGIPVAHVFRHGGHDPLAVFRQLPPALYPDYDEVHRLMRSSGCKSSDGQYASYPASAIVEFTSNNEVLIELENTDGQVAVRASYVVVLIGSRPNLQFLNGDEYEIGRVPGVAIDGKRNPVDVDAYTYQSNRRPGLYAIGPLVGDNFVRFLRGGAVGVAAHLWSMREDLLESRTDSAATTVL